MRDRITLKGSAANAFVNAAIKAAEPQPEDIWKSASIQLAGVLKLAGAPEFGNGFDAAKWAENVKEIRGLLYEYVNGANCDSDLSTLADRARKALAVYSETGFQGFCPGCKNEIDPHTCHCGEPINRHGIFSGHNPVPMGCDCGRNKSPTP